MKKIKFLRVIVLWKKVLKFSSFLVLTIFMFSIVVALVTLIPPIRASLFIKILIISPLLVIGLFLRNKFSFNQDVSKLDPLNSLYCFLYFFVFILTISYIPKIICVFSNEHTNYFLICIGIIIFFNFGDFLIRKIKITYLKYRDLIEKGKKYNEMAKRLHDLANKFKKTGN